MSRGVAAQVALAGGVLTLYLLSFSSVPTSDGYWILSNIDRADYASMLVAQYPLTSYTFFSLKRLLAVLGISAPTLSLIQTGNAAISACAALLLFAVIRVVGGSVTLAALGGALLPIAYGYWYFANGEMHHLSSVLLILIFFLILRARLRGGPDGHGFVMMLGLLNALAILLRQENFLFGFTAVAMLLVGRPWRQGVKQALAYGAAGSLATAVLAVGVGVVLRGTSSVQEFVRWYFWIIPHAEHPQQYQLGAPPLVLLRVIKGQLTALIFGTHVVGDAVRHIALLRSPKVAMLVALTCVAFALMAFLLGYLWRARQAISGRLLIPLVGCLVWLFSYKAFLHAWFWPTAPEYHIVTLAPLLLLLLLGPAAVLAEPRPPPAHRVLPAGAVGVLLLVVLTVNFWGGILPWYRYGLAKEIISRHLDTAVRSDDLFISFESGLDNIIKGRARFLGLKGLFDREGRQTGFGMVREAIQAQLEQGGRVFAYNLLPAPYTLQTLNVHLRNPRVARYRAEEFEAFVEELGRRYELQEVLRYWEEAQEPLYLFGLRLQPLWEVRRRKA